MTTELQQLPELLNTLQRRMAHQVDILVPIKDMRALVEQREVLDENGVGIVNRLALTDNSGTTFGFSQKALPQLCGALGDTRSGQAIPAKYLESLVTISEDASLALAKDNVEFWLDRTPKFHANKQAKRWFVRMLSDIALDPEQTYNEQGATFTARAVLSDKFFKIDNIDCIRGVVEAIREVDPNESNHRAASGVRVVKWRLTDTHMDIILVNPSVAFDLNDPEGDLHYDLPHQGGTGHNFLRFAGGEGTAEHKDGKHLVYPAARITNSETGHGGLNIMSGIFEAVCANGSMIGHNVTRRHVGATMKDTSTSRRTHEKKLEVIRSEIVDAVGQVFDPDTFQVNCRKFAAAFGVEIPEGKVKEVATQVLDRVGLPGSLIDELLVAYNPVTAGKDTLGDVQRAVTNLAHMDEISADMKRDLENAGGKLLNMTAKAQQSLCLV